MAGLAVPISSRKIVPPSACMNFPVLLPVAPVKAPATWPNNSLSSRFSGRAPQATSMKGLALRRLRRWMARAIIDLPVPLSPVKSTVALVSATLSIMSNTRRICGSWPTMCSSPALLVELAFELVVFFDDLPLAEGPLDGHQQFVVDQRLGQVVEGAGAEGFHGGVGVAVAGHQDDLGGRIVAADLLQEVEAVAVLEADIDQHEVVGLLTELEARVGDARGSVDLETLAAEPVGHRLQQASIVVDQQQ